MVQYLGNALKVNRVSGWKSGLERLRMFFATTPGVYSQEKAGEVDCTEDAKTCESNMKEKLGGWWW